MDRATLDAITKPLLDATNGNSAGIAELCCILAQKGVISADDVRAVRDTIIETVQTGGAVPDRKATRLFGEG